MQVKDKRKVVRNAFLTVLFNLGVACIGIICFADYYTPGNPIRPRRIDVDILGYSGMLIGVSQAVYLTPLFVHAIRSRQQNLAKGIALGAFISATLNAVLMIISLLIR